MEKHWKYLKYILRHKWYVLIEGMNLGVPLWMLILHDWDKFLPDEWFPYVNFFYGKDGKPKRKRDETGYYKPTDTGDEGFDYAWFLHQKRNKHHWQWWVVPNNEGGVKILHMREKYRLEMLADWRAAGRAQGTPDTRVWYAANQHKMQLHPYTRQWFDVMLKHLSEENTTMAR